MNTKQMVIDALSKISVRQSEKSAAKIERKIEETAETLAPICEEKMLLLTKGSSSPTTQKSFERLYLEYPGASHNSNHRAYANVIAEYEWQTKSKYGFTPVPQREFLSACDTLVRKAQAAEPFVGNGEAESE